MPKATIALLLLTVAAVFGPGPAEADQYVNGYTRQNETVVQPYVRSFVARQRLQQQLPGLP
jgi:hypothetical protein